MHVHSRGSGISGRIREPRIWKRKPGHSSVTRVKLTCAEPWKRPPLQRVRSRIYSTSEALRGIRLGRWFCLLHRGLGVLRIIHSVCLKQRGGFPSADVSIPLPLLEIRSRMTLSCHLSSKPAAQNIKWLPSVYAIMQPPTSRSRCVECRDQGVQRPMYLGYRQQSRTVCCLHNHARKRSRPRP